MTGLDWRSYTPGRTKAVISKRRHLNGKEHDNLYRELERSVSSYIYPIGVHTL